MHLSLELGYRRRGLTYNPEMKRLRHNWFIVGKYNPVIKGQRYLSKQNKVAGPQPAE